MYNSITVVGRLAQDPDLEYTKSGTAKVEFTVAEDARRNQNGEKQTQFHPVVSFGDQAENHNEYLSKGSAVTVRGHLDRGKYQDDDGKTKYYPQIIGYNVTYLSLGGNSSQLGGSQDQSAPEPDDEEDIPF